MRIPAGILPCSIPDGCPLRVFVRGTSNNLLEFIPDNRGGRMWNADDHTIDTAWRK
jgi:hypothetical protein